MNHNISQESSPRENTRTPLGLSDSGQSDTKEIMLLAGGLITLVLGLGSLFMYSMDEPVPATASQKSAKAVSHINMTEAFATAAPSSPAPISHEASPSLEPDPALQLVANVSDTPESVDTNVYFEFNQWALSEGAKNLLKTQVDLQGGEWTGLLRIDGHTDAQGTDSYNRALGLKRAEAVKTYLVSLGIPEDTIQIQSFGKDGAVCEEQTPDCFEHNRRAHVAFLPQANVQEPETLISMTPDAPEDSTSEASSSTADALSSDESEEEMLAQEEISGELVASDPLASTNSAP